MNPKRAIPVLLFYALSLAFVPLLEKLEPSGPCNPGAGIMYLLFLVPLTIIMLAIFIYKAIRNDKSYWQTVASICIGVVLLAVWLVVFE